MYAAIIVYILSLTLPLDSILALIPVGMVNLVYLIRTHLEDRMLQEGLSDDREYTGRVHYRLIPWIR